MTTIASVVSVSARLGRLPKGVADRPNDKQHQRLGRQRLDEPPGVKQRLVRMKVVQQHVKREEVELEK